MSNASVKIAKTSVAMLGRREGDTQNGAEVAAWRAQ